MSIHRAKVVWYDVEKHPPPHHIKLMVTGPSYMTSDGNYLTLAYIDEDYRPPIDGKLRWIDIHNDAVTDREAQPTHWTYPIIFPGEPPQSGWKPQFRAGETEGPNASGYYTASIDVTKEDGSWHLSFVQCHAKRLENAEHIRDITLKGIERDGLEAWVK